MTWVRLDDGLPDHPKFIERSGEAVRLWVFCLCWCNRQKTDGRVTMAIVRRYGGTDENLAELESAGLLEKDGNCWKIHDYLEYQPSRDKIDSVASARSEAGKRGANAKQVAKQTDSNLLSKPSANSKQVAEALPKHISSPNQTKPNQTIIDSGGKPPAPKAPRPKAERFVPETWQPNDAHQAKATELGVILRREVDSFRAHEFKVPKTDWDRAFSAWLTRAAQFATSSGGGRPAYNEPPQQVYRDL